MLVFGSCFEILDEDSCCNVYAERYEGIHLIGLICVVVIHHNRLTELKSMWLIIRMIEAISAAAVTHRILLSLLTLAGIRYLSALKIAAWCKQIAEVCMHMFANTTLGSVRPEGRRRWSGRFNEVWRSICSMARWRFQNPPLMSSS